MAELSCARRVEFLVWTNSYLIADPTMNMERTSTANPMLMICRGFRPTPRHSPVERPQRFATTTINDMTIAQPIEAIGRAAVQMILEDNGKVQRRVFDTKLVVRGSTAAPGR